MKSEMDLRILDCTLRDGGYYNQWDFPADLVSRYLQAVHTAGIRTVELGFRSLPQEGFLGPFAYTTDYFISTLDVPEDLKLGVMINAKEFLQYPGGIEQAVDLVFQPAVNSRVELVRIAVNPNQLTECAALMSALKKLGYAIGLNLMHISHIPPHQLREYSGWIKNQNMIDVFYIADSLGSLDPKQTREIIQTIQKNWDGPVGIHTHDNMGNALENSLTAIETGAAWIDGTILGMGRGAGNACTELLILELTSRGIQTFYPDALFSLVIDDFEKMKKRYGWGNNLLYYLSGKYGIHPTYIQEILSKPDYQPEKILAALESLKNSGATSFKDKDLEKALNNLHQPLKGSWSASGWAQNRDLLILGSGPQLERYKEDVVRLIKENDPVVVSLNINPYIAPEHITAYATCHKTRLLMDSDKYQSLNRPIIAPMNAVPEIVKHKFKNLKVFDYGMGTSENTFLAEENDCVIPLMLVAAYVFALGISSGASRILLAGFDGYDYQDPRHKEMEHILNLYKKIPLAPSIISVTPTTYSVTQSSIYSPEFSKNNSQKLKEK
ncbi:MAG: aldolase [Candidatus Omnitrophica bacterium]|nr:aldolase [Candidatus Omnitrophota bacterium]